MRRMDRGDVDGVDRRVGKERVVTVVHGRYVEHPREICRLLPLAAGHGGRPARLREAQSVAENPGDTAGSDDAPVDHDLPQ